MENKEGRAAWLDAVRSLAITFVMLVHAIGYTKVLSGPPETLAWYAYLVIRFAAMSGVPLFLMLSGYLCSKKTLTRRYFLGIAPVLLSYVVISILSVISWNHITPGKYTLRTAILAILNYKADGYAWYVEMYIGLFVLIPFLNILWNGLDTKKKRLALIGVLSLITVLPSTLPGFHLFGKSLDVVSDYWTAAYPLTYYFIGAYMKEYPIRLKLPGKIVFAAAATALPCVFCIIASKHDGSYAWYMLNGFGSATAMLTGIAYFTLFQGAKLHRPSSFVLKHISLCSFEMYLSSYITDHFAQNVLKASGITHNGLVLLLLFALSFSTSFVFSFILRLVLVPLSRAIKNAGNKTVNKSSKNGSPQSA